LTAAGQARGAALIVGGAALLGYRPGAVAADGAGVALLAGACLCWAADNNLTQRLSGRDPLALALMLTEEHSHGHTHEPLAHDHAHLHDEHHRHHLTTARLGFGLGGRHAHFHRHEPLTHDHPHVPDIEHRHGHG
jgi:hypothetical protein